MHIVTAPPASLVTRLAPLLDTLPHDAPALDERQHFPARIVEALHAAGALAAPLPVPHFGQGLGTEPGAALRCFETLHAFGRAWMPLGRVFEGHVNAIRLIVRYGTAAQAAAAADDVHAGRLFAVWIAENPADPVRFDHDTLHGAKTFASGQGAVTRAVVTAREARLEQMVLADVGAVEPAAKPDLHGMRGAGTARVDLTGVSAIRIGRPGDYMRQPEISLGAWRTLAVLSGGAASLVDALRSALADAGRDADPHQRARLAACLAAQETARLWAARAAALAEAANASEDASGYVKLARLAVTGACLTIIEHAQRSAGLAAFVRPSRIERLCRDLSTYVRQPALDETLDEAAAHFIDRPLP